MKTEDELGTPIPNPQSPIIFLVGPTASGKSSLAMEMARQLDGEIVCADSQTVRKRLDIGTAKPSLDDQRRVPHHLLDIIGPYDLFSVNQFKLLAASAIVDIQRRQKIPIVVGGTGLYINALYFDYDLQEFEGSDEFKQNLEKLTVGELHEIIQTKGYSVPENKDNKRHLIGTILRAGKTNHNKTPIPGSLIYGLQPDDEELKKRIDNRVEDMFKSGFVQEVLKLLEDFGKPTRRMDAIGYPIVMRYIDGEIGLEEAKQLFKTAHWQYTRRQKSWFKLNPRITWLNNGSDDIDMILREVKSY